VEQVHGDVVGDALGQLDGGSIGDGAGVDFRQCEARAIGGDDEIGRQGQFEAAAHSHAVDCGDHRLVQVTQLLQAGEAADAVVAVHGVAFGGALQVPAGGEEFFAGGGDDGDAMLVVVAKALEDLAHFAAGCQINGVGLGPIQGDFEDAVAADGRDGLAHVCASSMTSRASAAVTPCPAAPASSGLMSSSSN